MTDTEPLTPSPIIVNANPAQDQLEAGVRQFLSVIGLFLPLVGLAKYTGTLNWLIANATIVSALLSAAIGLGAIVWGQWKTRVISQKSAAMATILPDSVATTK